MNRERSKAAFERSQKTFAGGVGSAARLVPEPFFIDRGEGARVIDLDGNIYIDYVLGYGPLILGHSPKVVNDAIVEQLTKGTMYGACCELEYLLSEEIVRLVPCIDLVRFTNSGAEALHFVLRLARAYTGREKVVKFEGHYHGWLDNIFISAQPAPPMGLPNAPWKKRESAGQPENAAENLIILPFNDLSLVEKTLRRKGHEIAAIILEPIMFNHGGIMPEKGYLEGLRELTEEYEILLIFDEIVTGFRLALGGAQQYFSVTPDLCAFGKGVGGGYPISGFGGRTEIMRLVASNAVPHMGTFNSNPLCVAAALATVQELAKNDGETLKAISEMGANLKRDLNHLFETHSFPMRAVGTDPIFVLQSPALELRNYRDFLKLDIEFIHRFHAEMMQQGIWFMRRGNIMLSAAHTELDLVETVEATKRVIQRW